MAQLEAVGLAGRADDLASELPLAGQRRLELARALAAEPRLLLLDEPAGGMTPAETGEMARLIAEHAMPGRGVIVIEHKIDMLARLCRRLCALNFGRKIAEGDRRGGAARRRGAGGLSRTRSRAMKLSVENLRSPTARCAPFTARRSALATVSSSR
jgi:ABC-type multidrug transport system ATPase subunit